MTVNFLILYYSDVQMKLVPLENRYLVIYSIEVVSIL